MDDWTDSYKHIKEFADLCEDTLKLRYYHNSHQYAEMMNHIRLLAAKYPFEAGAWNTVNTVKIPDSDYEQHFRTADMFLETLAKERLLRYHYQDVFQT